MNATFMHRCTPRRAVVTTRKGYARALRRLGALGAVAWLGLAGAGCATRGPLHLYTLATAGPERKIQDIGNGRVEEVPSFLKADELVTGFAYDPFTDHFFLRIHPGNRIRVVDRPARAIKREFTIEGAPEIGGGDLAIRPRDGHLFLLRSVPAAILETSRLGRVVRTLPLAGLEGAPLALAFDPAGQHIFVLNAGGQRITVHDLQGARTGEINLSAPVGASLAFDPEQREFFAPLAARPEQLGVFDERGQWRRAQAANGSLVDVGVRSFVRVF